MGTAQIADDTVMARPGDDVEDQSAALAAEIASWQRVVAQSTDKTLLGNFERACVALFQHDDAQQTGPRRVVVDRLQDMATIAGIDDDTSQSLMSDATKVPKDSRARCGTVVRDPNAGLDTVCAADLAGRPVPSRQWHVENVIPGRTVTGLSGDGGTGKTILAEQLAAATAGAGKWLGFRPSPGPVLYLSAEDEIDELHRRLVEIAGDAGIDLADLRDLHFIPLAGQDSILATFDRTGAIAPRPLWH